MTADSRVPSLLSLKSSNVLSGGLAVTSIQIPTNHFALAILLKGQFDVPAIAQPLCVISTVVSLLSHAMGLNRHGTRPRPGVQCTCFPGTALAARSLSPRMFQTYTNTLIPELASLQTQPPSFFRTVCRCSRT
jgi:hypothetical protein